MVFTWEKSDNLDSRFSGEIRLEILKMSIIRICCKITHLLKSPPYLTGDNVLNSTEVCFFRHRCGLTYFFIFSNNIPKAKTDIALWSFKLNPVSLIRPGALRDITRWEFVSWDLGNFLVSFTSNSWIATHPIWNTKLTSFVRKSSSMLAVAFVIFDFFHEVLLSLYLWRVPPWKWTNVNKSHQSYSSWLFPVSAFTPSLESKYVGGLSILN